MKAQVNRTELQCDFSKYLKSRGSKMTKDWTNKQNIFSFLLYLNTFFLNVSQMYTFYRHQTSLVQSILRGHYMYTERDETFRESII